MLNVESISKAFGDQILFDNTGFQINPQERVGLVGRNGFGKTTLLNMIAGTDHPDEGRISCPSGYRMGILSQKISFSKDTVLKEAMLGLAEHERDHYWKAEKILTGLGFTDQDMEKDPGLFSGGFQVRLNLAKVLVSDPDLLILDEPTNYLDITSIRWISSFLISWPREVLLVTHDRGFMDKVITHVVGVHRQKLRKIKGQTQKYYLQVAQDEDIYEKTRQNEEKKNKEIEEFITRFRAKARLANMVQSRIKTLEKSQPKEKLSQIKNLEFSFNHKPFAGKQVMTARELEFSWTRDKSLISHFSLTVYPHDRVAIIGKNGRGKTTLLKLLSQNLNPGKGDVRLNPGVSMGYFEQTNVSSLNDNFTVEEELINSHPDFDRQACRNVCGAMMFQQDAALKKISVLSGGEKSRVMLGKMLLTPLNLLLLDEPTNHLDMESCDSFVHALDNFPGAVVLVTHNELFLHSLATRLVVFKPQGIALFEGTYQEFLDKEGWGDEETIQVRKRKPSGPNKKKLRRQKSAIIAQRSRVLTPLQKQINKIEDKIEEKENRVSSLNGMLLEASSRQDGQKIQELAKDLAGLENRIEQLFTDLERLTDEMETGKKDFDIKLKALEEE